MAKMELCQKNCHEIALFDFTSFFGLDFFKYSGPMCDLKPIFRVNQGPKIQFRVPDPSLFTSLKKKGSYGNED